MGGVIHRFLGKWGEHFVWAGSRIRHYNDQVASGVSETWLVGKAEQARNFAIRYYEVEPGGRSRQEQHAHDHGLVFLRGEGQVRLGDGIHNVAQGDVVYIPSDLTHQIINTGHDRLGFLCVIPAFRVKGDRMVWAEEGLDGLVTISEDDSPT